MPGKSGSESGEGGRSLPQHPRVGQLKPDPAQPAQQVTELTGLPGDSDRAGYQRLYLTAQLDYYAEFLTADIVYSDDVPADQSPFPGLEATRVGVRRDAAISYTWVRSPRPVDEFDLDVRLGGAKPAAAALLPVPTNTCLNGCAGTDATCEPCRVTQVTCETCATRCHQATCATCNTQCNQATCATCAGQATCATCATRCDQATCVTCHTCAATCAGCTHLAATCDLRLCHTP
jgi:hypothetical protein